jgi:hypothetical protein
MARQRRPPQTVAAMPLTGIDSIYSLTGNISYKIDLYKVLIMEWLRKQVVNFISS